MKEGEGRKAKEGRRWKKEAKISMKEGREEGERRKDINEGKKEGNMPETRVPTQYFREDAPDAKEGKKGRGALLPGVTILLPWVSKHARVKSCISFRL